MKKLTIRLDSDIHKLLKLNCIEKDVSINEFITNLIKLNIPDFDNQMAIAKEINENNSSFNTKGIEYIKATMAYENLDVPEDTLKIIKGNISGKYSNDEARRLILEKHRLV
ncbi:HicB-like protein involved in pilus formation [Natranaerovirga pectinivora]|uniref:HicB-like protein involved in pilus formation n=1 Tax=Natranaerovirga pectinivora TaxID=682400 RepID=A0A4R3MN48_9FIRM|nr:toxin-antitoxin system HicB family antitoxin [Natranaerovirga pectinivora]TCT14042.1 HicB-like protein involved in pilus formation [Natranaerovirga pectinivora]